MSPGEEVMEVGRRHVDGPGDHISNFQCVEVFLCVFVIIFLRSVGLRKIFVFLFLNRNNPKPDVIETAESLRDQGYSDASIKRELRAQKSAQRQHDWLRNSNIRTARSIGKSRR